MPKYPIEEATIHVLTITDKTEWIFVELRLTSGLRGWGEATAQGIERAVVEAFQALEPSIRGHTPEQVLETLRDLSLPTLALAAAASAIDQAAWDIIARSDQVSISKALDGKTSHSNIPVYANINRRTLDRTPSGFARSASDAINAGHQAIKIAPFDEVTGVARAAGQATTAIHLGLERMRAVRETIGPDRRLMVDCHWRLDMESAQHVVDASAEIGLYWLECPFPEDPEHLSDIRALRSLANAHAIKLAGCEHMIRVDGFRPFLTAGAYDVIMPDVKYAGGLTEFLAIAKQAARDGVEVSPHNPTGPISHAMSLHLCSALGGEQFLEMQFDETPLFQRLQSPELPGVTNGRIALPEANGVGVELDRSVVDELTI